MKNHIPLLNKILEKGYISPTLRRAIEAIIKALNENDLNLAYQLSVCKSYVAGRIEPKNKTYAFQEDSKENEKLFKRNVYCILDSVHHDIALAIHALPSGMMIVGRGEVQQMKSEGTHPIIKRIKFENAALDKRFNS
jgi:hypothetical protein